jgi:hypothetical protein
LQDFPKKSARFFFVVVDVHHIASPLRRKFCNRPSSGILFKKFLSGITKGHDIATFSKARLAFYGVPPLIDL